MNKTTLAGKVSAIEVKQSKDGTKNFLSLSIEYGFIKQDGQPQIITYRASVFNEHILAQYSQGLLRVGCYVVAEAQASARAYQGQDNSWKAAMDYTINSLTNLSIREFISGNTQPQPQVQMQPQMQQGTLPNINNVTSTKQLVGLNNVPSSNGYNGGGNII